MDKQLNNLIYFINHPSFVVFWVEEKVHNTVRHKLTSVKEHDDELKAYINKNRDGYIDLYNVDFEDIEVMTEIDWKIL